MQTFIWNVDYVKTSLEATRLCFSVYGYLFVYVYLVYMQVCSLYIYILNNLVNIDFIHIWVAVRTQSNHDVTNFKDLKNILSALLPFFLKLIDSSFVKMAAILKLTLLPSSCGN